MTKTDAAKILQELDDTVYSARESLGFLNEKTLGDADYSHDFLLEVIEADISLHTALHALRAAHKIVGG